MTIQYLALRFLIRTPLLHAFLTKSDNAVALSHLPHPCWRGDKNTGIALTKGVFPWGAIRHRKISNPWCLSHMPMWFLRYVHSFDWMYDIRASNLPNRYATTLSWLEKWLSLPYGSYKPMWESDIVARRITAWLSHYSDLALDMDKKLRNALLSCMARHLRHLQLTRGNDCTREKSITALRGLIIATLSLQKDSKKKIFTIEKYLKILCQRLEEELKADGFNRDGHLPTQVRYIKDSILIQSALYNTQYPSCDVLAALVERMIVVLKFFRHPDGKLAHMAGWNDSAAPIAEIIDRIDSDQKTPEILKESGFFRVAISHTLLLFNATRGTTSGALSFEMSHKKKRIFCDNTAALKEAQHFGPPPSHHVLCLEYKDATITEPPHLKRISGKVITENGWKLLQAKYDLRQDICSCTVTRAIAVNARGDKIHGYDIFRNIKEATGIQIRFPLHANVCPMVLADNSGVIMRIRNMGWRFRVFGATIKLEDSFSIHDKTHEKQRTQKIVLQIKRKNQQHPIIIKWSISAL